MCPFTERNASVFYRTDRLGTAATIGGETVNGVFGNEYVEELEIDGNAPVFECVEADVSGVSLDDSVVISGTTYKVRIIEPDGTGHTKLVLEET